MPSPATLPAPTQWGFDAGTADIVAAVAAATAASAGGDSFVWTGKEVLLINNGSGGSLTVTVVSQANNFGTQNAADNLVVAVAAGKTARLGPFSGAKFRDANGLVQVTYSGVTSLKAQLINAVTTS